MMLRSAMIAGVLLLSPSVVQADCGTDPAALDNAVAAFMQRAAQRPLPLPLDAARCFRREFVDTLGRTLGEVVGYKVGLYTAASRKTFGAASPEIGALLRGMLLDGSKPIPATLGFAPIAEADFVLVVGDERINEAQTREEFYRHLRGYRPFIELPDNNYPPSTPVSAGQLVALNVNARAAVVGEERPLPAGASGIAQLAQLSVTMTVEGDTPKQLSGKSLETLGDPLEIAMFARDALRREGGRLRVGELISIGALVTPHPPRAGERFHVLYRLGDETSEISVRFSP
jgi:2-keto-4-pentenoate hydratase